MTALHEYEADVTAIEAGKFMDFPGDPMVGVRILRREIANALWNPWAQDEAFALIARCDAVLEHARTAVAS